MFGAVRQYEEHKASGKPPMYWLHSVVLLTVTTFGGGTIAPLLIGRPAVIVANDIAVPACIICWSVPTGHVFKLTLYMPHYVITQCYNCTCHTYMLLSQLQVHHKLHECPAHLHVAACESVQRCTGRPLPHELADKYGSIGQRFAAASAGLPGPPYRAHSRGHPCRISGCFPSC